ncbi:MAG: TetR/AcrR family transcriptional regulator [Oenococcus oeni]
MAERKNYSDKIYGADKMANIQSHLPDSEKALRADAKENKEQILQAGHKIFAEKGLSVPISEIAREAGIGIGTVYRHFPTKEALFNAVNSSYKKKLTEEAQSLADHTDPGKTFFDFFSRVMEECFSNRALRDSFRIGTIHLQKATSGVWLDFQLACANLLTRAQEAKAVREDIEIVDLFVFMSGLLSIADEPGDIANESRFQHLLSVVCDGLRYKNT